MQKSCLSTGSHGTPSRPLSTCHCLAPDRPSWAWGEERRLDQHSEPSQPSCPRSASYAARSPAATPSSRKEPSTEQAASGLDEEACPGSHRGCTAWGSSQGAVAVDSNRGDRASKRQKVQFKTYLNPLA